MATKRRSPARRRTTVKRRATSAPRRRPVRRRSMAARGGKMTARKAKSIMIDLAKATAGGYAVNFINGLDIVKNQTDPWIRIAIPMGAAFAAAGFMNQPAIAHGMAGAVSGELLAALGMGDNWGGYPVGSDLNLSAAPQQRYLQAGPEMLMDGIYPDYAPSYNEVL